MKFRLPFPPSINTYWRHFRGRPIISAKGREYGKTVAYSIGQQRQNETLTGRLAVTIHMTMPNKIRRDIDNFQKVALDALTHAGVWGDDSQIDDLRCVREAIKKPGWIDVEITEIG